MYPSNIWSTLLFLFNLIQNVYWIRAKGFLQTKKSSQNLITTLRFSRVYAVREHETQRERLQRFIKLMSTASSVYSVSFFIRIGLAPGATGFSRRALKRGLNARSLLGMGSFKSMHNSPLTALGNLNCKHSYVRASPRRVSV